MKPSISLYLPLLLVLLGAGVGNAIPAPQKQTCKNPADIEDTCSSIAKSHPGAVDREFCVKSLRSDHRSKSADVHGLAVVATRHAIALAASTDDQIDDLLELEPDGEKSAGLRTCKATFTETINGLRNALDNLNSKLYPEAKAQLSATLGKADACEEAMKKSKDWSLKVGAKDREYEKSTSIALAIASSLE